MFQNAFHIAILNMCDISVQAGVLFEEEIIQKLLDV